MTNILCSHKEMSINFWLWNKLFCWHGINTLRKIIERLVREHYHLLWVLWTIHSTLRKQLKSCWSPFTSLSNQNKHLLRNHKITHEINKSWLVYRISRPKVQIAPCLVISSWVYKEPWPTIIINTWIPNLEASTSPT